MRGISWLAANQFASQEGLCTMEWVSKDSLVMIVNAAGCTTSLRFPARIFLIATAFTLPSGLCRRSVLVVVAAYLLLLQQFWNLYVLSCLRSQSMILLLGYCIQIISASCVIAVLWICLPSYHWLECIRTRLAAVREACRTTCVSGTDSSICSRTGGTHGKSWSRWPVAGTWGCVLTSSQYFCIQVNELQRQSLLVHCPLRTEQ